MILYVDSEAFAVAIINFLKLLVKQTKQQTTEWTRIIFEARRSDVVFKKLIAPTTKQIAKGFDGGTSPGYNKD